MKKEVPMASDYSDEDLISRLNIEAMGGNPDQNEIMNLKIEHM